MVDYNDQRALYRAGAECLRCLVRRKHYNRSAIQKPTVRSLALAFLERCSDMVQVFGVIGQRSHIIFRIKKQWRVH